MSKEAAQALADAVDALRVEDPNVDKKIAYHNNLTATYMKALFPTVGSPMELDKQQLDLLTATVGAGMISKFGR